MLKTTIKFTYEWKGRKEHLRTNNDSWQVRLKHLHKIYKIARAK